MSSQGGCSLDESYTSHIDIIGAFEPPALLFHYTSPAGLIGIIQSKKLWATNAGFLNDTKELSQARDRAAIIIENRLRTGSDPDQVRTLLNAMHELSRGVSPVVCIASLSEERDLLSQWRAYCPQGGYSIGFSSHQLRAMAAAQGFMLVKCIYDHSAQSLVADEIVQRSVTQFCEGIAAGRLPEEEIRRARQNFIDNMIRYGSILKNDKFQEEKEWRLISSATVYRDPRLRFRPGPRSIIPYIEFNLTDEAHPLLAYDDPDGIPTSDSLTVTVGPTVDKHLASHAVHLMLQHYIGHDRVAISEVPYRYS